MEKYSMEQLPELFEGAAAIFEEKKMNCAPWMPTWETEIWGLP